MTRQQLIDDIVKNTRSKGWTETETREALSTQTTQELELIHTRTSVLHDIQEIKPNPEAIQENLRLKNEAIRNQAWIVIFTTPINGRYAIDNQANRQEISRWIEDDPAITDKTNPRDWWIGVFKQMPHLAMDGHTPLAWEVPVPTAELKAQQEAQFRKDAEAFYTWVRQDKRISASHVNFLLVHRALGPGLPGLFQAITTLPNGPVLVTEDGQEIGLDPPNRAELAKWSQELHEEDQDALRQMAKSNDIAALRARAKQDRERNVFHDPVQDPRLQFEYSLLKKFAEQEYLLPELPKTYLGKPLDQQFIRQASPDTLRTLISKFGVSQLNLRLHGMELSKDWRKRLDQLKERFEGRQADFTRPAELQQALADQRKQ
jgi:hypothetical protein